MAERSSELTSGTELPVPCCRPRGPAGPGCAGARDRRRADASGPRSRSAQPGVDHSPEQGAEMGEHAAALEAACTAISDLAAALADVRAAALDGDGVQAEPAGNGGDRLAVGAGRHRGGPTGIRSGRARIWRCWRERVQGPARVRGRRSTAPRSGPLPSCHLLDGPGVSRVGGDRAPRGRGQEELFSIQDAVRVR